MPPPPHRARARRSLPGCRCPRCRQAIERRAQHKLRPAPIGATLDDPRLADPLFRYPHQAEFGQDRIIELLHARQVPHAKLNMAKHKFFPHATRALTIASPPRFVAAPATSVIAFQTQLHLYRALAACLFPPPLRLPLFGAEIVLLPPGRLNFGRPRRGEALCHGVPPPSAATATG